MPLQRPPVKSATVVLAPLRFSPDHRALMRPLGSFPMPTIVFRAAVNTIIARPGPGPGGK